MPYFVYLLRERPLRRVAPLGEFARYAEASRFAKAQRAARSGEDGVVRVVFGEHALAAEDALLNPREAPPRTGADD